MAVDGFISSALLLRRLLFSLTSYSLQATLKVLESMLINVCRKLNLKLFIVSDLCKNKCIEIVVLDLKFFRMVESCPTVWLSIAFLMVHVKKNR